MGGSTSVLLASLAFLLFSFSVLLFSVHVISVCFQRPLASLAFAIRTVIEIENNISLIVFKLFIPKIKNIEMKKLNHADLELVNKIEKLIKKIKI